MNQKISKKKKSVRASLSLTSVYIEAYHPLGKWVRIEIWEEPEIGVFRISKGKPSSTSCEFSYSGGSVNDQEFFTFESPEDARVILGNLRKTHRNDLFRIVKATTAIYPW